MFEKAYGAVTRRQGYFFLVSLGSAEYQQNSSNYDKSMKLGMMVGIDHTNRFRVVDKMKYAYLGQRSRSKFTIE